MGLKKKRAQMIGVVSTLAVASLVSVGFAGWVISNTQKGNDAASISADYEIQDKSISALVPQTESSDEYDHNICFGAPETDSQSSYSNKWLSNTTTSTSQEDLVADFVWTFSVGTNYDHSKAPTVSAQWTDDPNKGATGESKDPYDVYNSLADVGSTKDGLVAALPTFEKGVKSGQSGKTYAVWNIERTAQTNNYTLTISIKLGWGKIFDNKNPYDYYNGLAIDASGIKMFETDAGTALNAAKYNIDKLSPLNASGFALGFSFTVGQGS